MNRREFVKQVGLGLAAGWAVGRLSWPFEAWAAGPELRLALLADAHLKDGNDRRPEALALARAVAEIRGLSPPPDLVLFAGDLAHRGRPDALDLGREILADLPAPFWAVRGEGDHGPGGKSAWVRRWGEPWFSRSSRGCQVIGLDTAWRHTPRGPVFEIGAAQRQWLARELTLLSPSTPLVILSHAPLAHLFHPWQQWTGDAPEVARLLGHFPQVLCLHGHVHGIGIRGQGSGISRKIPPIPPLEKGDGDLGGGFSITANLSKRSPKTENENRKPSLLARHRLAPAPGSAGDAGDTAPRAGPPRLRLGLGHPGPTSRHFQSYLWQA